jgi:hypothetical protein
MSNLRTLVGDCFRISEPILPVYIEGLSLNVDGVLGFLGTEEPPFMNFPVLPNLPFLKYATNTSEYPEFISQAAQKTSRASLQNFRHAILDDE